MNAKHFYEVPAAEIDGVGRDFSYTGGSTTSILIQFFVLLGC